VEVFRLHEACLCDQTTDSISTAAVPVHSIETIRLRRHDDGWFCGFREPVGWQEDHKAGGISGEHAATTQ